MASSSSSSEKKFVLISSDDDSFEISEAAAQLSVTLKNILEDADDSAATGIPLRNVDSITLAQVLEFCNRHTAGETKAVETLKEFDKNFIESVSKEELFDLVLAANYLDIKPLLELATKTIAEKIKEISVEDCRAYFNIENDFTEEEEEEIRKKHEWAYELGPTVPPQPEPQP